MTCQRNLRSVWMLPALWLTAVILAYPARAGDLPGLRSWVDEQTAVSVTAQKSAWTFFRRDVQATGKLYNFADLGAFEVNQTGKRRQYLCLLEWVTAPILRKTRVVEDFSTLTIWADDQPLAFPRYTVNRELLHLTDMPFKGHTYNVLESYYEVSLEQLLTLSQAKSLRIAAANQPPDAAPYRSAKEEHKSLLAFTNEVVSIAKQANSSGALPK